MKKKPCPKKKVFVLSLFNIGWKRFHSIFDDAVCDSISSLLKQIQENSTTDAQCSLPSLSSKETRREVHQIVRKAFPCLQSDTEGDQIVLRSASNQDHFHKMHRKQWPYPDRNYVEFTLKKRGKDTMSVLNSISNACRRAPKAFTVYGTKDKRAVTFQKVVAYRISPVGVSFLKCLLERAENCRGKNQGYFHRRFSICN